MKERPIPFKAHEVRATLEGRKSQFRRVVKPQPADDRPPMIATGDRGWDGNQFTTVRCPYGQPGDRLWGRETWGMSFVDIASGRPHVVGGTWGSSDRPNRGPCVVFRADAPTMPDDSPAETARWSPSIHMPRWASRITLEVTGVRVERLQDISEADAIAEGIERLGGPASCSPWKDYRSDQRFGFYSVPSASYRSLWESINGPESWGANPWVWVVEFRRLP